MDGGWVMHFIRGKYNRDTQTLSGEPSQNIMTFAQILNVIVYAKISFAQTLQFSVTWTLKSQSEYFHESHEARQSGG